MRNQPPSWLKDAIAFILIFILVYAASSKLMEHWRFQEVLGLSPLIGGSSAVLSWLIPLSEILVSGLLFANATRRLGFWLAFLLMLAFTLYISYIILFVPNRPCSCGGILSNLNWTQHMLFNIAVSMLALLGTQLTKGDQLFIAMNRSSRIPV
jgi:hypothetical protein